MNKLHEKIKDIAKHMLISEMKAQLNLLKNMIIYLLRKLFQNQGQWQEQDLAWALHQVKLSRI